MDQISTEKYVASRFADPRLFWPVAALLAFVGLLVFRQTYLTFILPHYPTSFDQLALLHNLYGIYYGTLADPAQSVFDRVWGALGQCVDFKGWVLPAVGTLFALLFGPSRDVFVMMNYLFLVLAGGVLLYVLRRRLGTSLAVAALGLVLLSNSLYYWAGGLTDLRWDCAGLATFGIFFCTFWFFGVDGGRKGFGLILLTYVLTLLTRSTSGVYGLCSVAVFGLMCTAAWALTRRREWRNRWFATLRIGVTFSAVFLLFLVIHYQEIRSYYLHLLLTAEGAIRLREGGVGSRVELLLYYGRSFWDHFSVLVTAGGILIVGHLLIRLLSRLSLRRRAKRDAVVTPAEPLKLPLLICASFLVGPIIPMLLYAPSPIVIGALTIPLAVTFVTLIAAIGFPSKPRWTLSTMRLLDLGALIAGCVFFVIECMSHSPWPSGNLDWAHEQDALMSQLVADYGEAGATVSWLTINDGLNDQALETWLYEHNRYQAVSRFEGGILSLFPMDMAEVRQRIASADVVIAHRGFPPIPLYPSLESMREMQSDWQAILDRQFVLRAVASLPSWSFGYYSRPAAIVSLNGPFGFGYDSPRKRLRNSWVFMGADPAVLRLRNFKDVEISAKLGFDAVPGPGAAGVSLTIFCGHPECATQHLITEGSPPWHFAVPVKLSPGVTELRVTAAAQQPAVNGHPPAGIGHPHLIWDDHQ
jgi:hypothetical protein